MTSASLRADQETSVKEGPHQAAPKWAAVVDDTLIPLPRRHLLARDVLAQAGLSGVTLLRDYNDPADVALGPDTKIDLGEGNVFRTVTACEAPQARRPTAPPKLAFVADDAWEVTVTPRQTAESLRGLFGLPEDAELLRDRESPDDDLIAPGTAIDFADGPVFRTRIRSITVKVNNKPVRFTRRSVTGLEIKQTAIAQGVAIDVGFVLYPVKPGGGLGGAIADSQKVVLKACDEFRCVAPDDNS